MGRQPSAVVRSCAERPERSGRRDEGAKERQARLFSYHYRLPREPQCRILYGTLEAEPAHPRLAVTGS